MIDVFVVGALHLDVVVNSARLPQLDETLMGESVAYRFGGKGGNQALAARRMGASVAMAGRIGEDAFAGTIRRALDASGVDHSQVRSVPGATGMSVAIVEDGGEYGAVVVSGVNQSIDPTEVNAGEARVVLLQNEIPEAVNLAVARARSTGAQIILNAAPARRCAPELLAEIDLLVVNRLEARQMAGRADGDDILSEAKALAALGVRRVVVTAGKDGGLLLDGDIAERIEPPVRSEGSAHGAGDAFVGALATEVARGAAISDAARFAALAAAHFVQVPPDARERITREAVEAWGAAL